MMGLCDKSLKYFQALGDLPIVPSSAILACPQSDFDWVFIVLRFPDGCPTSNVRSGFLLQQNGSCGVWKGWLWRNKGMA